MTKYVILYKPKEYKKRWLLWNKSKYSKKRKRGEEYKTKKEAADIVKALNSLYADKFKLKRRK